MSGADWKTDSVKILCQVESMKYSTKWPSGCEYGNNEQLISDNHGFNGTTAVLKLITWSKLLPVIASAGEYTPACAAIVVYEMGRIMNVC